MSHSNEPVEDGTIILSGIGWAFDMLSESRGPGLSTKILDKRSRQ